MTTTGARTAPTPTLALDMPLVGGHPAPAPAVLRAAPDYAPFRFEYRSEMIGRSCIIHANSLDWLARIPEGSLHALVTDPPYGVKEYELEQIEKRTAGVGGIWRLPPVLDGVTRAPLPRFTDLTPKERKIVREFFLALSRISLRALRPGGHMFLASNSFLSQLVFGAMVEGGLEFRGELLRLVRTLRGGDRPKNAEIEFDGVSSMARGCYEPWGIFRKPLPPKMTVAECLREYQTGGLRRISADQPFSDVIYSEKTPKREKAIADHPSLKPQSLMRQIVRAALPLGEGIVADPFMGSGSTVAAAEALGYQAIGIERHGEYFQMATDAIPRFRDLTVTFGKEPTEFEEVGDF